MNTPRGYRTIHCSALQEHGQYRLRWRNGEAIVTVQREDDFGSWAALIHEGRIGDVGKGHTLIVPDGSGDWYEAKE